MDFREKLENWHGVYIDEFARIEVSASGEREDSISISLIILGMVSLMTT